MTKIIHIIAGKPFSNEDHHQGCLTTLEKHGSRVDYFLRRMDERGDDPKNVVVNFVNVDDPLGNALIDLLMPGQESVWQSFRDKGEVPYGRGLATREGYQELLDVVHLGAGNKLRTIQGKAVIVVDHDTVEVFDFS